MKEKSALAENVHARLRKEIENGRKDVEHYRKHEILLVRRHEAPDDEEEIFHIQTKSLMKGAKVRNIGENVVRRR